MHHQLSLKIEEHHEVHKSMAYRSESLCQQLLLEVFLKLRFWRKSNLSKNQRNLPKQYWQRGRIQLKLDDRQ